MEYSVHAHLRSNQYVSDFNWDRSPARLAVFISVGADLDYHHERLAGRWVQRCYFAGRAAKCSGNFVRIGGNRRSRTAAQIFQITIPMLSPTLFFVTVISIIGSFQVFTQVNVMTQGGPGTSTSVLVYYIYKAAFTYNKIGYANAIGWVLFILVFIFTVLQWKFSNKDSHVN